MNKSLLTTIIVIIVIVIAGGVYFWMQGGQQPANSDLLASQSNPGQLSVGAEELALLNQVSSIKIHSEFFQSPLFLSLVSIVQQVPTVPVGRANPFAPVPGVPSPFNLSTGQTR